MKKSLVLSAVLFLAAIILPPASSLGKYNPSKPIVADGSPLPWPIPPGGGTLVADGSPLPWPIPPSGGTALV